MTVPTVHGFLKKSTIAELESGESWRSEETYVTRGAYMHCTMGTHEEVLNQIGEKGVLINESPMMTVKDCAVSTSETINGSMAQFDELGNKIDGNFYSFGYCRSLIHPLKAAELSGAITPNPNGGLDGLEGLGLTGPYLNGYNYDCEPETGTILMDITIYPCVPKLLPSSLAIPGGIVIPGATEWQNGSPTVLVNDVPVLTTKSCLYCTWGGKIKFLTNGMDPAPPEFLERGPY
ncbi:hypothetical protein PAECIP111893_05213 [Paenibacillus plantiphilus]|uniref:DUF4280 domain-containing protein n=1 Tax=Paenibacillus plantiphilus TaxID=2905650 RepID=A0ABN8H506_9BACL|nr:DUF4280 domain-containing protein [Paenibacillus plantiphilus]CAH1225085.1 hypothetical protein PAECIP111893_05213 [Paenibacillus plantiphilus]